MTAGFRRRPIACFVPAMLILIGGPLRAEVLRVPTDHPTIKSALNRASDGDTVLVDDGTYLEKDIEVAKSVLVKSRNPFGAVIYGYSNDPGPIFKIRAAARIEGFILKGGAVGIEQRESPDVRWEAEDLLVIDCRTGLSVNDAETNVGSARIRNVIIIGVGISTGVATNSARDIEVSNCLIMNCLSAFEGYDHISFRVKDSAVVDCAILTSEQTLHRPVPPATSRVETGENVLVVGSRSLGEPGRFAEARSFLRNRVLNDATEEGLSAADRMGGAKRSVLALILAKAMAAAGDLEAAAESYDAARAAAESARNPEIVWQALWGSIQNEGSRGRLEDVLRLCRDAADHLERWIPHIPTGIHNVNFLKDKSPFFERIIGLLLDHHVQEPSAGYDREAFYFAERAKCLGRLFPPRGNGRSSGMDGGKGGDKTAAFRQISSTQLALQDPDITGPDKERLVSRLEAAEDNFHAALVREERTRMGQGLEPPEQPGPAQRPYDYSGVRTRLDGRGILSYVLGAERAFAFLATEEGLRFVELPPAGEIEAYLASYLRFLQIEEGRGFTGEKGGALLYDKLLAPVIRGTTGLPRRLVIVPDGRLFYLPFETLVRSRGDRPGAKAADHTPDFLAGAVDISYAPSATQALAGEPWAQGGARPASLLAVGDSGSIRCDNRSRKLKRFFAPLGHVRSEVRALARAYPWKNVTILVDNKAGEGPVKSELSAGHDIFHVAAHGVIDDADWWRSALLLRPEAALGEDGMLTALEIADLDIPVRLVVLSGCGTGSGSLFQGEGIIGLSGAFLQAGADYVMVSLWNVDDKATAVFMEKFYAFLAQGDSPARASARAKMDMIRSGLHNPFYWAPFVLIGRAPERR